VVLNIRQYENSEMGASMDEIQGIGDSPSSWNCNVFRTEPYKGFIAVPQVAGLAGIAIILAKGGQNIAINASVDISEARV
jgi:hypothetical protein